MTAKDHRTWQWYALALVALVASWWIGWSDFTPWVPQAQVQEAVRAAPRNSVQLLVQFVAPALLVGLLANKAAASVRARRKA